MAERIAHRGPDDFGAWADATSGIALAFRRLAVIDVSMAGHQPMVSANGRMILVYNGEIYNHKAIHKELVAAGWNAQKRSHSDTETLLAALQFWGIEPTLQKLNGMFAFGLWDREKRILTLARDRVGEKPLYYGTVGGSLLFASELKAMTAHPEWTGEVNRGALTLFLRYAYIPAPHSIYQSIHKLPPAHYIEFALDGHVTPKPVCYWSLLDLVRQERRTDDPEALVAELEARLKMAVAERMEADVPLGAFLSGGIDSSAIVAMMQSVSARPIRTFTIGFDVPGYNEAENAKIVAAHLGTMHTELYVTSRDALDVVPSLPRYWDEPFADSSQIPTFLLSRMAREHVTVAMSGDGGDELFGGYNRYGKGYALHRQLRRMPEPFRHAIARVIQALPLHGIDRAMQCLPQKFRYPAMGDRLQKLGAVLQYSGGAMFYRALVSQFQDPAALVLGGNEPQTPFFGNEEWPDLEDFRECMMFLDTMTYLPGDILAKVDRASMAVSLETRLPFLDHDLIKFAWSLPVSVKIRGGQTKWVLRRVLHRHVPRALMDRPKMGFGIPIEHWLTGPLHGWASALLDEGRLRAEGYLNAAPITRLWQEHCSGKRRWHHQLWAVLMFQSWLEHQKMDRSCLS